MDVYDEMIAANRGDEPESDQIDMMDANELRTEFRASQAREAALQRKLAEQQAYYRQLSIMLMGKLTAEEWAEAIMGFNSGEEELRKLLEESNVDSLRYRFLRRAWAEPAVLSALNEANPEPASDAEFDASVDAAMLAVQPKEPKQ